MPTHTFTLNGESVTVEVEDDVRLLWVIRDILGVTGPKYGCGIMVCRACTSHINGKAFNPCAVPVGDINEDDEITTIEGLADTVDSDLHPMQEAWIEKDVAQCGYCQPRPDHGRGGQGPPVRRRGPQARRRRHRRDPQHLPMRHLPAHPRSHLRRRREHVTAVGAP